MGLEIADKIDLRGQWCLSCRCRSWPWIVRLSRGFFLPPRLAEEPTRDKMPADKNLPGVSPRNSDSSLGLLASMPWSGGLGISTKPLHQSLAHPSFSLQAFPARLTCIPSWIQVGSRVNTRAFSSASRQSLDLMMGRLRGIFCLERCKHEGASVLQHHLIPGRVDF